MFAILPEELQRDHTVLAIVLILIPVVFWPLALMKKRFRILLRVCFASVGSVSIILFFCAFPTVSRVPRLYQQGKDQFYWAKRLHSNVPQVRREAASALADMLCASSSNMRVFVIQELGECEPAERKIALRALLKLAKNDQENQRMRWEAEYAIGIMFFQHVFGDIGLEEERISFQKKILKNGWDAVELEVANRKNSKSKAQ